MDTFLQDLRQAWRSLCRSAGLSLAAVLTLALGIGANSAMFGVIDQLFFRPPPGVADPGSLVRIQASGGSIRAYPRYADLRDQAGSFAGVAAYFGPTPLSLGQGGEARSIRGSLVTASFFGTLGLTPALGRFFTAEEDAAGGSDVLVVSREFWRRELGGTAAALGRPLQIGQRVYTVIGVAPAGFRGLDLQRPDVWLPLSRAAPDVVWAGALTCDRCSWLLPIARLAQGVTPAQAASEATGIYRRRPVQPRDSLVTVSFGPVNQVLGVDAVRGVRLSTWLAAACGIVLLIACVNVANLLLARASQRQREMALRVALGSPRGRLIRQLYLESGLLAGGGGLAALVATLWVGPALRTALLPTAAAAGPLELRTFGFTLAVATVTTVLAGLAPALYGTRPDLTVALKAGVREGGTRRTRMRQLLLVGQVALTMVLLTGAGLFVRSVRAVDGLRLGFDADRIIVALANLAPIRSGTEAINAEYRRMQERVAALPGVEAATLSIGTPFRASYGTAISAPGVDSIPDMNGPYLAAIEPGYFRTLGTRVLRGRGFTEADVAGAPAVAVVTETLARIVWRGQDPLGRCLRLGTGQCREVIGVVEDSRQDRVTEPAAETFIPLAQADSVTPGGPVSSLVVRTRGAAESQLQEVRRAIQTTAADLPYVNIDPLPRLFADQVRPWRVGATLFGLFGGMALLLGAVGVYGVLSYSMSQRTHEIGVRVALGAQRGSVLALVLSQGLRIALAGVLIGSAGALAAGRALSSLVYGVSPYDPGNLALVAAVLVAVAAGASLLPALGATRVDPLVALRQE